MAVSPIGDYLDDAIGANDDLAVSIEHLSGNLTADSVPVGPACQTVIDTLGKSEPMRTLCSPNLNPEHHTLTSPRIVTTSTLTLPRPNPPPFHLSQLNAIVTVNHS
jgi:hypothetical protein